MALHIVNDDMGQTSAQKQRTFRQRKRETGHRGVNVYVAPQVFDIIESARGYSRADRVTKIVTEWAAQTRNGRSHGINIEAELKSLQSALRAFGEVHGCLANHADLNALRGRLAHLIGRLEAKREED